MARRNRQLTLDMAACGVFPDELEFEVMICAGEGGQRHLHWEARQGERVFFGMEDYDSAFTSGSTVLRLWDDVMVWWAHP